MEVHQPLKKNKKNINNLFIHPLFQQAVRLIFSIFCLLLQIIIYILSFLHTSDRKEAALVCSRWYTASQDLQFQVLALRPQTLRRVVFTRLQAIRLPLVAEECYLLLPGLGFVPGADQESRSEAALQAHHQPAGWLQYVQTAASGGPVTLTHLNALSYVD